MESSTKPQLRSISLPCTLTPNSTRIKINLRKLKTLVPLCSSESNQSSFVCLVDLYHSVDELIGSSRIQQLNLHHKNNVIVENVFGLSTRLLDSCSSLLEFLALMKKNLRTLQSALRRKRIAIHDPSGDAHILDYVRYRKKAKNNILDYLRSLEQIEKETAWRRVSSADDHHLSMLIGVLREIVLATIYVFRALLLSLSGNSKLDKGFSLIAKVMCCARSQEIINALI